MNLSAKNVLVIGCVAAVILVAVPSLWGAFAGWQGGGYGMMGPGMMGGYGWMGFGGLFMVLFWGLIIWGFVALVQGPSRPSDSGFSQQDSALNLLKRRYARGEIGKEEYEEKKRDLV